MNTADRGRRGQEQVIVAGALLVPVTLAVNPTVSEPPAGIVPLYGWLVTVTACPDCVSTPFHKLVICWLPGKFQASFQPFFGLLPVSFTTT
jgi:hypothetical protein